MDENSRSSPPAGVRHLEDHPIARHRRAGAEVRVTADEAAETARPLLSDFGWPLDVSSGEAYRNERMYGTRIPVPLEEMWAVSACQPGMLDGPVSIVGVSKRTGEVLFSASFHSGG
ncbi:MAG: hypothetical protein LC796_15025 [Acidobacteria bacterium]|nr:hypothetical protein [Acidobacteriota bacterium]MCA1612369.1 hypothetical protein [Acidobacteriota bacterium]